MNRHVFKNRHVRTAVTELMRKQGENRRDEETGCSPKKAPMAQGVHATHTELYTAPVDRNTDVLTKSGYFPPAELEQDKAVIGKCLARMELDMRWSRCVMSKGKC